MRWALLVVGVVIGAVLALVWNEDEESRVDVRPEESGSVQVNGAPDFMDLTLTELGANLDETEPDSSGLFSGLRVWLQPVAREEGGVIWEKKIVALDHGTYRLKLRHRRLKTVDQLVTVGTRTETIELELAPK